MKIKNRRAIDYMLPTVKHSRRKLKYETVKGQRLPEMAEDVTMNRQGTEDRRAMFHAGECAPLYLNTHRAHSTMNNV